MYALYLFVLTVYWSMCWGDASACPYTHLEDVVLGNKSLRIAFLLIWAEVLGGIAVFRYIQALWALEIVSTHKNRAFGDCTTDLQARPDSLSECVRRPLRSHETLSSFEILPINLVQIDQKVCTKILSF